MHLAVIIATYNERDNIEPLIRRIFGLKLHSEDRLSVIVVDDRSDDGTGEILGRLESEYRGKLHVVIRNERNRATAAITGFKRALGLPSDCILEMDGDLSHNPDYIPQFLSFVRHYDVVIGSRYVEGGGVTGWPLSRKIISACSNFIYRLVLGTKIHDLSGGYKCYRRKVVESLHFDEFFSNGYSIGVETLFHCYKRGYSFLEIPIVFQNRARGKSKFRWREAVNAVFVIGRLVFKYGRAVRLWD